MPFLALISNGLVLGYNDCLELEEGPDIWGGRASGVRPGAIDCRMFVDRWLFPKTGIPAPAFDEENIGIPEFTSPGGFIIVSRRAVIPSSRER